MRGRFSLNMAASANELEGSSGKALEIDLLVSDYRIAQARAAESKQSGLLACSLVTTASATD